MNFDYMHRNTKIARVEFDEGTNKVRLTNYTDDVLMRPFGINEKPTKNDFYEFLEWRCFPKGRMSKDKLLKGLGLAYYEPMSIVKTTHGAMFEDFFWIKFDGEEIDYETQVKLRD